MKRIWVVEMYNAEYGKWEPMAGMKLHQKDARHELLSWQKANSSLFRLTPYLPEKREAK